MIRVLSFDPGEKNFAFSITEHKHNDSGYMQSRSIDNGIIENTITDLKDSSKFIAQAQAFSEEIRILRDKYEIETSVALERFMGRGIKVGTTSETTNIMIGIITNLMFEVNKEVVLINAATWKNAYNKIREKSIVKSNLKDEYKLVGTTPHQFDATLIGIYYASSLLEYVPFKMYYDQGMLNRLMTSVEKGSRLPLVKRKAKR